MNGDEGSTYPNLWDATKTMFTEKFVPLMHLLEDGEDG